MFVPLVVHELRALRRTPTRILALVAFLATGIYALFSGQAQVERWQSLLADAAAAQSEQHELAMAWYESGRAGPEESPWIDVRQPVWADRYAASYLGRAPAPLAAFALGLSDARTELVEVQAGTNPFDGSGIEFANPEKLLAGHLDLAFVLAFLAPLLLIVLAFDVGGFERDNGMLALVRVQANRLAPWILWRVAIHTAVVAGASLVLVVIGGFMTDALRAAPTDLALFAGLVLLYLAGWGALVTAVVALGRSSAFNALALAVAWITLCLLGPAAAQTRMQFAHPPDYGTELTSLLREETYALFGRNRQEHVAELFARLPELEHSPYSQTLEPNRNVERLVLNHANLRMIARRGAEQDVRESALERDAARMRWILPIFALQHGLNVLAGNEADAYRAFRAAALASVEARLDLMLEHAFHARPFDGASMRALIAFTPPPKSYAAAPDTTHYGPLLVWLLLPVLAAAFFLRTPRRAARPR